MGAQGLILISLLSVISAIIHEPNLSDDSQHQESRKPLQVHSVHHISSSETSGYSDNGVDVVPFTVSDGIVNPNGKGSVRLLVCRSQYWFQERWYCYSWYSIALWSLPKGWACPWWATNSDIHQRGTTSS